MSPAGVTVAAMDHDRLFKELLEKFFLEFSQLLFPKLAASIDPAPIEFMPQELFASLLEGGRYQADIIVKVRFKDRPAFFIIHAVHRAARHI